MTTHLAPTPPARLRHLPRRAGAAGLRVVGRLPWGARLVAAVTAATVVARAPGLVFNGLFDRDEAYLAVMGDVVRHGGELYVDVVDRKPPLVIWAYGAARDLSVDMRLVRLLCALAVLVNGVLAGLLVRRLVRGRRPGAPADVDLTAAAARADRAAIAAGVLAVLGTAWFLPADAQAANFELWGLAPATGAVLAAVSARTAGPAAWHRFALAGALVVVAVNVKQPYVVVALPVALEAMRSTGRVRLLGAAAGGAALAMVPIAASTDLGLWWRWVWTDNADYLDGGLSLARALGVGLGLTVVFLCFHVPLLYGFWAAVTRRIHLDPVLVVWTVASLVVVALGLRFFGHYYQQVVPALAVLTGVALADAPRWAWRIVGAGAVAATVVLVSLSFVHRPDLSDFTALGRFVQRTTSPDDRILVWGALPDVYVAAQRDPSGVFLHGGYLTGNWASRAEVLDAAVVAGEPYRDRWQAFFADLLADPPELVVDAARPGTDWAGYQPERYPVGGWLERCYDVVAHVDGLPVWKLDRSACAVP